MANNDVRAPRSGTLGRSGPHVWQIAKKHVERYGSVRQYGHAFLKERRGHVSVLIAQLIQQLSDDVGRCAKDVSDRRETPVLTLWPNYGTVTAVLAAAPVRWPIAINLLGPAGAPDGMTTSAENVPSLFALEFPNEVCGLD